MQNISVRRSSSEGVCYVKPLPEDAPRPKDLNTGFTEAISRPTDYQISTVNKEWIVSGEVDKIFLRKEIREFCDQYPVYRLREYVPDSVSVGRSRRAAYFYSCRNHVPDNGCSPQDWKYRCRVRTRSCVYYITCNLDERRKTISCNKLRHTSSQTMCCNPYCPYGRASYGKGR